MSWTLVRSNCPDMWPATLHFGKANTVKVACNLWWRSIGSDVWWSTDWDGSSQLSLLGPSGGQQLNRRTCPSWDCYQWNSRFFFQKACRLTHTRRAYQKTASRMFSLQQTAYKDVQWSLRQKTPCCETNLSYVTTPCPHQTVFLVHFAPQYQTAPPRETTLWPQRGGLSSQGPL